MKFSHMPMRQPQPKRQQQQVPPIRRPYSWKTDEFQVKKGAPANETQRINRVRPIADIPSQTNQQIARQPQQNRAPQQYQGQQQMGVYGYRCPRCASQLMPQVTRKISSAGWLTFALLLVFFFPLFWIGLLIKEDVRTCPVCNYKVSQ